jgi:hypothetical protein
MQGSSRAGFLRGVYLIRVLQESALHSNEFFFKFAYGNKITVESLNQNEERNSRIGYAVTISASYARCSRQ